MKTPPPAGKIKKAIIFVKQHLIFMKTPPPAGGIKMTTISLY